MNQLSNISFKPKVWSSPKEIAESISKKTGQSICLELGCTGSLHAGSIRLFYFAEQVQQEARKLGKNLEYIIRVNDLVHAKSDRCDYSNHEGIGHPIASGQPHYANSQLSNYTNLVNEIKIFYKRTGWLHPEIIKISEVYRSSQFRLLVQRSLENLDEIELILSKSKKQKVSLFYPICRFCNRLHSSKTTWNNDFEAHCLCQFCGKDYLYNPISSQGLITFKLEQALVWEVLKTAVDVHGQDHIEAFNVSNNIMAELEFKANTIPARVNLVFCNKGEKLSKSKSNFVPFTSLKPKDFDEQLDKIRTSPYRRPITL